MPEYNGFQLNEEEFNSLNSLNTFLKKIKNADENNEPLFETKIEKNHLISIRINFYGLSSFPSELKIFHYLQYLDLSDNYISHIPNWTGDFKELLQLRLDSNLIFDLSENIKNLSKLTSISLNENKFRRIPSVLNVFNNLKIQMRLNNLDSFFGCSFSVYSEILQSQIGNLCIYGKTNWLFPKKINEWLIHLAQNWNTSVNLKEDMELQPIVQSIWQIYQKSISDIIQDYKQGYPLTEINQERLIIEMNSTEWPQLQPLLSPDSDLYKKIMKHMEIWHFLGYD